MKLHEFLSISAISYLEIANLWMLSKHVQIGNSSSKELKIISFNVVNISVEKALINIFLDTDFHTGNLCHAPVVVSSECA